MKTNLFFALGAALLIATPTEAKLDTARKALSIPYFTPFPQHRTLDLKKIQEGYLIGLRSENDGMIESALAHGTYLRLACPNADLDRLHKAVKALSTEGPSLSIRYKASLALLVFADPSSFKRAIEQPYETGDELFEKIAHYCQNII